MTRGAVAVAAAAPELRLATDAAVGDTVTQRPDGASRGCALARRLKSSRPMQPTSPVPAGDVDRALDLRRHLRAAADPRAITDDAVRIYCAALGKQDHRMEAAILRQAPTVIDVDALVDGLIAGTFDGPPRTGLDHLLPNRRWARIRRLYWARLREYLAWRAR